MKIHIKAITLLIVGTLVLNFLSFGVPVRAAAPAVGIPIGVGIPINSLPQDIYKGFKDAYNKFINDIFGMSNSYSYDDYDGISKTATAETVIAQGLSYIHCGSVLYDTDEDGYISVVYYDEASQKNYFVDFTLKQYSKFLSTVKIEVDVDTYNGENVVSFYYSLPAYDSAVKEVQTVFLGNSESSSIIWDMKHINGVPQNQLEIKSDITLPCFDYLNLNYTVFQNFEDPFFDIRCNNYTGQKDSRYNFYYPFVITSDKTLFCSTSYLDLYSIANLKYYVYCRV